MQISTSGFYDRTAGAMSALNAQAETLNTQISSGKKLSAASDDSVAYQTLQGLARATSDDTAYGKNLTLAAASLKQADTTLTAVTTQLQRASELVVQARNGTLSATNRAAIGTELASIADALTGLGNTKDPRGQPIFGGTDGGDAVTKQADGSYAYATTTGSAIPIGQGQSVQTGDSAARVFKVGSKDTIGVIATLAASLQAGTASDSDMATAITDLAAGSDQVTTVQASLGARATRVDLEQTRLTTVATDREAQRSALEDTDVTTAITQLQKTMTILSATQASFTKLSSLSLFDYLK